MNKIGPFFRCQKCGVLYNADPFLHGNVLPDEEIAKLRAVWYKASDNLFSPAMERFDKLNIPFEAMELERPTDYKAKQLAEIKTLAAYLESKQVRSEWKVPDNLITVRVKDGHRLECHAHHERR